MPYYAKNVFGKFNRRRFVEKETDEAENDLYLPEMRLPVTKMAW